MLPIQPTRIFDYQQPTTEQFRNDELRANSTHSDQNQSAQSALQEDRRKKTDRRTLDRREKQQATFLNTRKIQGRRRTTGRRASDIQAVYRPISLKG